ncbi:radical SAM/SPASM domain-containing protein [Nitratiruptor tergarcus]|uniref:Radical SAM additional 4Fe4S-binding SPASM domain-containing protein n=1 Tax=Nitratiruptor tergarcus DSM 16512 TaxID=1069081 RepID=A0A1W1WQL0_9BACT|nr:radical SAM protein [Nitratiruptor tergarcus]SMC08598.1 radical SAM additional 4Fe4S-binding SPASM domain-containing protein [Nitratiruptor tergarcus DSM 16512]
MFRLSNLLKSTLEEKPSRALNGAIAIWNFTNRCNLSCLHCYSKSGLDATDTLTTEKILSTIPQLKNAGIKFVIFSGGEPLTRKDIFLIAKVMKDEGIMTYLSTNGLYINPGNVEKIIDTFGYIGISIDGDEKTHDRFRGLVGSYAKSLQAIDLIHQAGGKVGIRFTITKETKESLAHIFELAETKGIDKIYISHLVYSGRGLDNLAMDLTKEERKEAVDFIIEKAFAYYDEGRDIDIVTGNMEMDAVVFLEKLRQKYPHKNHVLEEKLRRWGGNSAGRNLVNINSEGDVKPDPFFPITLGNIFDKPFDEIWLDNENPYLQRLRQFPRKIGGKCAACEWIEICNGGSRPRAWAISGDLWDEDPSCYIV